MFATHAIKLTKTPMIVKRDCVEEVHRQAGRLASVCIKVVCLWHSQRLNSWASHKEVGGVCRLVMLVCYTYLLSTLAVVLVISHSTLLPKLGHILPPPI